MAAGHGGFRVARVRLEVRIGAPRRRVWAGLTRDIGRWWPRDFLTRTGARRFVVEPRVGGRVFEDAGDGEGLLWYTVVAAERGRRLQLSGDLFPAYGGPARLQTTFALEPDGAGTLLRFEEVVHGRLSAKAARSLREGWSLLLGERLKAWAERGTGPAPRA